MAAEKTVPNDVQEKMAPDRATLCISSSTPGLTLHGGDTGFSDIVQRHYTGREAQANEAICRLKSRLPGLSTDDFWKNMMEGITEITGSQYALAVRRILADDNDAAVEMPELGDPGQCFMATAFFYNDGTVHRDHVRDYRYYPYSGPCSHMKHDKVFIVPSDLAHFVGDQIHNRFAFPVESYIGIPLSSPTGECIGHFGALWSERGMKERELSWGYVETALHALEDVVTKKLLEGQAFSKRPDNFLQHVIPAAVVNVAQSLKPYARSLSHELRTPMQGVVGMLEIMHATVSEALEHPLKPEIARTFRMLRENIEVVQDSSRRAVEAADNVVHAADLDMQVPETPDPSEGSHSDLKSTVDYFVAGEDQADQSPKCRKRKREDHVAPSAKFIAIETPDMPPRPLTPRTAAVRSAVRESGHIAGMERPPLSRHARSEVESAHSPIAPATKITRVRDHLRTIVNECLRYGGRPESAIAKDTARGEIIEARSQDGKGQIAKQRIEWSVHPQVPDEIHVDERDFTKLVSVLLLNALKFTRSGKIQLSARLENSSRLLVVNVLDTGTGIPAEFIPNLFKAFSRQDDTITRQSEGLGLGLLVAKGVARKVGGDLRCVRSDTGGPSQGSEFEFKVPLSPSEASSRQSSPGRTPTPAHLIDNISSLDMHRSVSTRSKGGMERDVDNNMSPSIPKSLTPFFQPPQSPVPSLEDSPLPRLVMKDASLRRSSIVRPIAADFDRELARKHPLKFLVAEDNRLNRKLLVTMLGKLGYTAVREAFDGAEAVRLMEGTYHERTQSDHVDVILMDLWMPNMDGYEAARRILDMERQVSSGCANGKGIKILAVTADATDGALDRAKEAGMTGFMTKPYKMLDLEKLIIEHCAAGA